MARVNSAGPEVCKGYQTVVIDKIGRKNLSVTLSTIILLYWTVDYGTACNVVLYHKTE